MSPSLLRYLTSQGDRALLTILRASQAILAARGVHRTKVRQAEDHPTGRARYRWAWVYSDGREV